MHETPEFVLLATSPGHFEAVLLLASLQELMHFPGESAVTFESLLWKTVSVVVPRWAAGYGGFEMREV